MRIHEAAAAVLSESKRPMHAKEIHGEIVRRGLFRFGAKDPVSIVAQTLRKKSAVQANKGNVVFEKVGQNTYRLAG